MPRISIKKAVLGILAIVIVAGIAGAAYYVSNQLSTKQGVAPTAPESEPQAAEPGQGCCKNPSQCKSGKEFCNASCVCKPLTPTPTGYGENYTCTPTNCPAPNFKCNSSNTSCIKQTAEDETPPPGSVNHCGSACSFADCHCTGGDACTGYECVAGTNLRESCANQGRSWCVNMTGNGMTCCSAGYKCNPNGNGCVTQGGTPTKTPTKTTTQPPTQPPTLPPTITQPPAAACTSIEYYVQQVDGSWKGVTPADLDSQAKPESRIKFAVTAVNTNQVDVKINNTNWAPTTKNSSSGKFEYIYYIPTAGTYNVITRYLKPPAANLIFEEDVRCTGTFMASAVCVLTPPVWSSWSDCSKSCGGGVQTRVCTAGSCGGANNCNAIDGGKSERACNTSTCESNISINKKAYLDEADNTIGSYTLNQEIDTVSKNQVFVYTILVTNNATDKADGVKITDPLTGLNQNKIDFKDKEAMCDYSTSDKTVVCNTSLDPGQTKQFSFRATVDDSAVNGTLIKNIASVTYLGKILKAQKDLLVSTLVSCNHTCTTDSECGRDLACDTTSKKCRNSQCLSASTCTCSTPTVARTRVTRAPVSRAPSPTTLPESGFFDMTGVAALGGGLILTVVGILLAL